MHFLYTNETHIQLFVFLVMVRVLKFIIMSSSISEIAYIQQIKKLSNTALSNEIFDGKDARAYTQLIDDYFANSEMEAETDNECSRWPCLVFFEPLVL